MAMVYDVVHDFAPMSEGGLQPDGITQPESSPVEKKRVTYSTIPLAAGPVAAGDAAEWWIFVGITVRSW